MGLGAEPGHAPIAGEYVVSPFCRTAKTADAVRKRGGDELGHELRVSEREFRGANSSKKRSEAYFGTRATIVGEGVRAARAQRRADTPFGRTEYLQCFSKII